MKTWRVPVTWEMCGEIITEAPTLEDAMIYARDDMGILPLPDEREYVDGSWRLSYDMSEIEEVRECWNGGQKDDAVSCYNKLIKEYDDICSEIRRRTVGGVKISDGLLYRRDMLETKLSGEHIANEPCWRKDHKLPRNTDDIVGCANERKRYV